MKFKIHEKHLKELVLPLFVVLIIVLPIKFSATNNNIANEVPKGGLPVYITSIGTINTHYYEIASNGTHIFIVSDLNNFVSIQTIYGVGIGSFGSIGNGNGQFSNPEGIVYANGHLYVVDTGNNRIEVFGTGGTYISQFGSAGSGNGQFSSPSAITADSNYIYVSDWGNHRIEVFDFNGTFIRAFGSLGTDPSGIGNVVSLVVSNGYVYMADYAYHNVKIYSTTGNIIKTISSTGYSHYIMYNPSGIAINDHFMYVSDYTQNCIFIFDLNGNYESTYYGSGSGSGSFGSADNLLMVGSNLYLLDNAQLYIHIYGFLNSPHDLLAYSSNNEISLSWQSPDSNASIPIKSYHVYRSTDGSTFTFYADTATQSFIDTNVITNANYYYKVLAVAENSSVGVSGFSNIVNASIMASSSQNPNNSSNNGSTTNGFLPVNMTFILIGLMTSVILIKKHYKRS